MVSGFFCIDKPHGMTSHDVVSRMRKILNMKKVGHSGTLDPMATGVLIVGCGTSTRLLDYVQAGIKEYVADVLFGVKTSSGDAQGEIVGKKDMSGLTRDDLEKVLPKFIGEIQQIPPMVSAIKIDGKKLYEYERAGIEIEREPRDVVIESIVVEDFSENISDDPQARLRISCHAGTYIRTLAEDIAAELGGVAHLVGLRRTSNGNLTVEDVIELDELKKEENPFAKMLAPIDVLSHLPSIALTEEQTLIVSHGKTLILTPEQLDLIHSTESENFVVTGSTPRELIAIFPNDDRELRSRCVVFLDDVIS